MTSKSILSVSGQMVQVNSSAEACQAFGASPGQRV